MLLSMGAEELMRLKTGAIAFLFVLVRAISALAQTATIKGTVKDANGGMPGLAVQLKDSETGRKYNLKTDKKGEFFSIGVSPGKYDVAVSKDGKVVYTTKFQVSLNLDVNELDIDLTPAPAGQEAAAQAPPPTAKQQTQPKLTEEQKKQIEEINKKNAEIQKE